MTHRPLLARVSATALALGAATALIAGNTGTTSAASASPRPTITVKAAAAQPVSAQTHATRVAAKRAVVLADIRELRALHHAAARSLRTVATTVPAAAPATGDGTYRRAIDKQIGAVIARDLFLTADANRARTLDALADVRRAVRNDTASANMARETRALAVYARAIEGVSGLQSSADSSRLSLTRAADRAVDTAVAAGRDAGTVAADRELVLDGYDYSAGSAVRRATAAAGAAQASLDKLAASSLTSPTFARDTETALTRAREARKAKQDSLAQLQFTVTLAFQNVLSIADDSPIVIVD